MAETLRGVSSVGGAGKTVSGRVASRALHRALAAKFVLVDEISRGACFAVDCEWLIGVKRVESDDSAVLFGVYHSGGNRFSGAFRAGGSSLTRETETS